MSGSPIPSTWAFESFDQPKSFRPFIQWREEGFQWIHYEEDQQRANSLLAPSQQVAYSVVGVIDSDLKSMRCIRSHATVLLMDYLGSNRRPSSIWR